MHNLSRRTLAFCVLLLGATASFAAAAKALPCADFLTTGSDDAPGEGMLLGSETISEGINTTISGAPGGVGGSATGTKTVTYEVGYYRFADGSVHRIDCRDYTFA
jgi:hypothetical protein